jgi:hypothetical protein
MFWANVNETEQHILHHLLYAGAFVDWQIGW